MWWVLTFTQSDWTLPSVGNSRVRLQRRCSRNFCQKHSSWVPSLRFIARFELPGVRGMASWLEASDPWVGLILCNERLKIENLAWGIWLTWHSSNIGPRRSTLIVESPGQRDRLHTAWEHHKIGVKRSWSSSVSRSQDLNSSNDSKTRSRLIDRISNFRK